MNNTGGTLILGASGGIGSTLARTLSHKGERIVLAGRDSKTLQELGMELDSKTIIIESMDIESISKAYTTAEEVLGTIDGTVNCIGTSLLKPSHTISSEQWQDLVDTNLTSAMGTVKGASKVMMKKGGSIVLIAAACGRIGMPYHDAISATKAGVIGLTLSAAATYSNRGIRVNCVAPGLIDTPMTTAITEHEGTLRSSESMHPISRIGQPSEVVSAITWLLDRLNTWVTGQVIGVDGGLGSLLTRTNK